MKVVVKHNCGYDDVRENFKSLKEIDDKTFSLCYENDQANWEIMYLKSDIKEIIISDFQHSKNTKTIL